jgi:hypothetical protein
VLSSLSFRVNTSFVRVTAVLPRYSLSRKCAAISTVTYIQSHSSSLPNEWPHEVKIIYFYDVCIELLKITYYFCFGRYIPVHILKLNSVVRVREPTILTERPPLVGEVIANFLGYKGCHVVSVTEPYGRILGFLDRSC